MIFLSTLRFWLIIVFAFYGMALVAQALPPPPTLCIASGAGNSAGSGPATVVIQWKDNSTSETQWIVRFSTNNGTSYTPLPALASGTRSSTGTVSYSWPGAFTNTTYRFTVQAFDGTYGNLSTASAAITTRPFIVTASPQPCESVNLSWQPVDNAANYRVFFRVGGTTTDTLLSTEPFSTTSYQVPSELTKSGVYYKFTIKPLLGTTEVGSSNILDYALNGMTSKTGITGAPGAAFVHTFSHTESAPPQTRILTGIPAGLSFNANTGNLTGVFPAAGIYQLNYTVIFTSGCNLTQIFTIRVRPANGVPTVVSAIPNWIASVGATRTTLLATIFRDPDADSAVRVTTTVGVMNLFLYDSTTPATVANFMTYVNAGRYDGVCFHRSVSKLIATGGYKGVGTTSATARNFIRVVADSPVANEYGSSNTDGTVAMVKEPENPNSATSFFAINTGDNAATLDYANGGSTVFGRISTPTLPVAKAINALRKNTYALLLDGSATTTTLLDFPLNSTTVLSTMDQTKLLKINSIVPIPTLTFAVTGNTNPAAASASIVAGELQLVSLTRGSTTITVTATDLDNLIRTHSFTISPADSYESWAAVQTFPGGQNGANQDPDQDGWVNLQEFAFLGNPSLSSPTSQVVTQGSTGLTPSTQFLTVTFPVRKQTQGISYLVEASMSLAGSWMEVWKSTDGFAGPQVLSAVNQVDRTVLTIKDTLPFSAQSKRFLRVTVKSD